MASNSLQGDASSLYGAIPMDDESLEGGGTMMFVHQFRAQSRSLSLRDSIRSSVRSSIRSVVDKTLIFEGALCSVRDLGGQATIASEVFNISKNLVGAGVLSLSGGIAIYADSPTAVFSASLWILVLGAIFGYFCWLIAKVCDMTRTATYREIWEATIGDTGALAVSLVNALKPALGNLAYSTILSQTFASLSRTVGFNVSRVSALLIITVCVLLPLCLLKNLHVLAPFSILGTVAIIVTAVSMLIRCFDGSYSPGGAYHDDIHSSYRPRFGTTNQAWSTTVLPFVCMVFEAFVMHYNSARFYTELKHASLPRFGMAVSYSFGLSSVIYIVIASAGFLTFGGNADGYILNNYSPHDPLATVSRLAIAVSTLLTFPLVFIGFRDGITDVLEIPEYKQTSSNLNLLTIVLLTIITVTAVFVTDLGMINAVGGGTLATVIVFVFPSLMYRAAVQRVGYPGEERVVGFVMALMVFGVVLGVIGVWEAIVGNK